MTYNSSNIFARIIRGEIPSHKIFENEHCLAILDAFPLVKGHCLLLPKAPVIDLLDMPSDVAGKVCAELPRICAAVKAAVNADAVTVVANNGSASGQVVFHSHFHVIPRYTQDNLLHYDRKHLPLSEEPIANIEDLLKAIKQKLT